MVVIVVVIFMFDFIAGVSETLGQLFVFYEMDFADGPITGRQDNSKSRLYIQEGAVVEISCKTEYSNTESSATGSAFNWHGTWLLNYDKFGSSTPTRVDSEIFEITDNFEQYHRTDVQDSTSLGHYVKFVSTLRYIGRLEDNGKYLQCRPQDGLDAITNVPNSALVILVVRRKFHHKLNQFRVMRALL